MTTVKKKQKMNNEHTHTQIKTIHTTNLPTLLFITTTAFSPTLAVLRT